MGDADNEIFEIAWPSPDDNFAPVVGGLRDGDHPFHSVRLDWPPGSDPERRYIHGYGEAAKVLLQYALESRYSPEALVYPILYLFRHHIELSLKRIIVVAGTLYGCDVKVEPTHSLHKLWQDATKCMQAGGKVRPGRHDEWRVVGRCIQQLNSMDAASEAVRYPTNKAGDEHVLRRPVDQGRGPVADVNLAALNELVHKITNFLEGVHAMLDADAECKAEMEAEARGYADDCY